MFSWKQPHCNPNSRIFLFKLVLSQNHFPVAASQIFMRANFSLCKFILFLNLVPRNVDKSSLCFRFIDVVLLWSEIEKNFKLFQLQARFLPNSSIELFVVFVWNLQQNEISWRWYQQEMICFVKAHCITVGWVYFWTHFYQDIVSRMFFSSSSHYNSIPTQHVSREATERKTWNFYLNIHVMSNSNQKLDSYDILHGLNQMGKF